MANQQIKLLIDENLTLKNDLNRTNAILNEILSSSLSKDEKIRKLEADNLELKNCIDLTKNNIMLLNTNLNLYELNMRNNNQLAFENMKSAKDLINRLLYNPFLAEVIYIIN